MSEATDLEAIGLLQDAARRSLYEYVVRQGREVSRNEAARAVGLQRSLAAFHLDRLAEAGLLEVGFRRLNDRAGPGAGRPAKLYRRASGERAVSLPARDYARAASVFAEAIERVGAEPALYEAAGAQGRRAGHSLLGARSLITLDDLEHGLAERGYEPYRENASVRLRNCPFHAVSQEFPVLACGMNLALLQGVLAGSGLETSHEARLDPRAGECCVVLASKTNVS